MFTLRNMNGWDGTRERERERERERGREEKINEKACNLFKLSQIYASPYNNIFISKINSNVEDFLGV
jgi:hypothetical protein